MGRQRNQLLGQRHLISGRSWLWTSSILLFLFLSFISPAGAQDNPTNTPDAQGLITVEVQPEDSLWSIAARAGISIPELLALNDLDETVVLQPGDRLIIARVTPPATATSDIPTPTMLPPTPSPVPAKPRTAIAVQMYKQDWPTIGERTERFILIIAGLVVASFFPTLLGISTISLMLWLITVMTHFGAVQRIIYTYRLVREPKNEHTRDTGSAG